jgi:hypothetical protein
MSASDPFIKRSSRPGIVCSSASKTRCSRLCLPNRFGKGQMVYKRCGIGHTRKWMIPPAHLPAHLNVEGRLWSKPGRCIARAQFVQSGSHSGLKGPKRTWCLGEFILNELNQVTDGFFLGPSWRALEPGLLRVPVRVSSSDITGVCFCRVKSIRYYPRLVS